jgi:hypothetical protein
VTGPPPDLPGHGDWDALAVGWALSALDPQDQARMAGHLPGCQRCTETVREAVHTVTDLAYAVPDESPPRSLKRQIMTAAAADPRRTAAADPYGPTAADPRRTAAADPRGPAGSRRPAALAEVVPLGPRRRRWITRTAVAAGVALLAALGAWNVQLRSDQDDLQRVVAQRDELVQRLTAAGPAEIAIIQVPGTRERTATVVVKDGRVGLITEKLTRRPGDGTYWLWSMRDPEDPSPVPLAGFNVPETRFSSCNIEPPAGADLRTFAISEELGLQRPARPGKVVGLGAADVG